MGLIRKEASPGFCSRNSPRPIGRDNRLLSEITQAITFAGEAAWINESLPISVATLRWSLWWITCVADAIEVLVCLSGICVHRTVTDIATDTHRDRHLKDLRSTGHKHRHVHRHRYQAGRRWRPTGSYQHCRHTLEDLADVPNQASLLLRCES